MLRVFKWIYRRGVLAERERIKLKLVQYSAEIHASHAAIESHLYGADKGAERTKKSLEASSRAVEIIDKLITPEYLETTSRPPIDEDPNGI
jgi:hypothetical protein